MDLGVPPGWRRQPAWMVLTPMKRTGYVAEDVLSVYRDHGVIPKNSRSDNHNRTPDNLDAYQLVEPGDVVFNKMKAWSGSVGVSAYRGIVSGDYLVCRTDSSLVDSRFLHYLLRSRPFFEEYARRSTGIRPSQWRLYWEELSQLDLPLPPAHTQRRIAYHLDAEIAQVEHARQRIRDLRALLDVRADAAVVRALSRQQDVVDIGIYGSDYWIGGVPEHWEVAPLGTRYKAVLGKMVNEERSGGDHQAPYLSNADVRWDGFDLQALRTMSFPPGEWERYGVEVGDILVCEGGEVGRAAVWEDPERKLYFQKALHRLRPIDPHVDDPRYMMYALMAAAKLGVFQAASNKATIDHLTGEKLAEHRFPFPPIDEQREIVRELDTVRADADAVIDKLTVQDELLAERKQALITAAVTGQITV